MSGMKWDKAQAQSKVGKQQSMPAGYPMTVATDLPTVTVKAKKRSTTGKRWEDVQAAMLRPGDRMVRQVNNKKQQVTVHSVSRGPSKMITETDVRTFKLSPRQPSPSGERAESGENRIIASVLQIGYAMARPRRRKG